MAKIDREMEMELQRRARFFAKKLWNKDFPLPVKINGRFKRTMGCYDWGEYIQIARDILVDEYILNDTLIHELCHWYCDTKGLQVDDGEEDFERVLFKTGATSTKTTDVGCKIIRDINILYLNKLYKEKYFKYIKENS